MAGVGGAQTFHFGAGLRLALYYTPGNKQPRVKFTLPRMKADKEEFAELKAQQRHFTDTNEAIQYTLWLASEKREYCKQLLDMEGEDPSELYSQAKKLPANKAALKKKQAFNEHLVPTPVVVLFACFI